MRRKIFPPWGRMAVTPVLMESPSTTVTCPTLTPATSVMALSGPVGRTPTTTPISRGLWRIWADATSAVTGHVTASAAPQTHNRRHCLLVFIALLRTIALFMSRPRPAAWRECSLGSPRAGPIRIPKWLLRPSCGQGSMMQRAGLRAVSLTIEGLCLGIFCRLLTPSTGLRWSMASP